jgi:hypothetical protein
MTTQQKDDAMQAVKNWLFPVMFSGMLGLIQYQYAGITNDIKELKTTMQSVLTMQAVYTRDVTYLQKEIDAIKKRIEKFEETK